MGYGEWRIGNGVWEKGNRNNGKLILIVDQQLTGTA